MDEGRGCAFGGKLVPHLWLALPAGMVGLELDLGPDPLYDGGVEVLFGSAWVMAARAGRFDIVNYGAGACGSDIALLHRGVTAEDVHLALTYAPIWLVDGAEAATFRGAATKDVQYARRVLRAGAAVRDAAREADGRDVVAFLERGAEDELRAHLLLTGPETDRDRTAAEAVAATFGAELVECAGCDSKTPVLVRGGALGRLGLGALEEPVERHLRMSLLVPF